MRNWSFFGSGASLVKYNFWHLQLLCAADNNKISPNWHQQQPIAPHSTQKIGCKIYVVKGWMRAEGGGGWQIVCPQGSEAKFLVPDWGI